MGLTLEDCLTLSGPEDKVESFIHAPPRRWRVWCKVRLFTISAAKLHAGQAVAILQHVCDRGYSFALIFHSMSSCVAPHPCTTGMDAVPHATRHQRGVAYKYELASRWSPQHCGLLRALASSLICTSSTELILPTSHRLHAHEHNAEQQTCPPTTTSSALSSSPATATALSATSTPSPRSRASPRARLSARCVVRAAHSES